MTDIQSSQRPLLDQLGGLNRSANNVSAGEGATNNLYTYIGISEPDKGHVYENQSIVNVQSKSKTEFDPKRHEAM